MREWLINLRGNIPQSEIAEKRGMTRQHYSESENGERQKKMDIQLGEKIAAMFGISVADIIQFEAERV